MSIFIEDEAIETVRDSLDIVNIVSDYVSLKKSGANYVGLCPFHNEKTPSFTVSPSKQFFHCFGCGEGGDGITFVMKQENLDFPDAIQFLADKLGISIETQKQDDKVYEERKRAYEMNLEAGRVFYGNLTRNDFVIKYLADRKIGIKEIRSFGLGYASANWDDLVNYLSEKGYNKEELEKVGLIGKRSGNNGYYDRFRNRLIFPILDTKSRVVGFGGRSLDDTMPKYLNSKETIVFDKGNHLYGLNLLNKYSDRKRIILVEGYMDVIALYSKGINYSVASLGTALTDRQAKLVKRYGEEVFICYDSDTAGIKATLKAIEILIKEDVNPKVILLPDGMDPDDYINQKGLLEFEKLIISAYNHIDYRIHIKKKEYDLDKIEDKIKFTVEVANIIKSLKSPIERDVYIDKISIETGISKEAIEKEIQNKNYLNKGQSSNKRQFQKFTKDTISPINKRVASAYSKAEIDLINLMIEEKDYFEIIKRELSYDDFQNKDLKEIYIILDNLYRSNEILKIDNIVKVAKYKSLNNDVIQSLGKNKVNYKASNINRILKDLINTVKLNKLYRDRREIIKNIEEIEKRKERSQDENAIFLDLCLELTKINNEIKLVK